MGAVTENLKLTVEEVKTYCRVSGTTDDAFLDMLLQTAKVEADNICNNTFGSVVVDGDGDSITQATLIPESIKLGCLKYIAYHYMNRGDCSSGTIPESAMACWKNYILIVGF